MYQPVDFERYDCNTKDEYRNGFRDDFERDYGRIIHSAAFRRLQGKTQVIGPSEGDYHRTRLTHTLEVSQIARGIAIQLNQTSNVLTINERQIDISLIESGALAHDLGHPPYGHQGERALNQCMKRYGGFEGNAHTFRLLTRLEGVGKNGLNLSRATLLSIIKYPILFDVAMNAKAADKNPPKSNIFNEDKYIFDWLIKEFTQKDIDYFLDETIFENRHTKTLNKTLECSIIELADDIAYATHDLQDVLKFNLLKVKMLQDCLNPLVQSNERLSKLNSRLNKLEEETELNLFVKDLINYFIQDIELCEKEKDSPRLNYKAELSREGTDLLEAIKKLIFEHVIQSQRVQTMEWKGGQIITKLFEAFMDTSTLLPKDKRYEENETDAVKGRKVCDYIAGMTDKYAENFYRRLYESNGGRLFDI